MRPQLADDARERVAVPRQDRRGRRIDRGKADPVTRGRDGAQCLGLGQLHRDHPPQPLRVLHETRAVDDDPCRVGERETPATWAAAISPTLWPVTAAARSPRLQQLGEPDLESEDGRLGELGGAQSGLSSPARSRSSTDHPASARTQLVASSISPRKTGSRSSSSRPMPGHWAPCPEKTKASPAAVVAAGAGVGPLRGRGELSRAARRARRPPRPRGASSRRGAWPPRRRDRRGRASARHLAAAPGTRAPRTEATVPRRRGASSCVRSRGPSAAGATGGASSITMCALVPPKPNALTPPQRPVPRGHGCSVRGIAGACRRGRRGDSARESAGAAGTASCCSDSTTLIKPAMPAAASRWPMLVLTEPSSAGLAPPARAQHRRASASTSIGSPSAVPVPCAST